MALSFVNYTGDGSNKNFAVPFEYIAKDDVAVKVDGAPVTFVWLSASLVQTTVAPAVGTFIDIRRTTKKDAPLVDFADASTLTESDLDLFSAQMLYIAQETADSLDGTITVNETGQFDANNTRIVNVADPVDPQDAVTKAYVVNQTATSVAAAAASAVASAASAEASDTARVAAEAAQLAAETAAAESADSAADAAAFAGLVASQLAQFNTYALAQAATVDAGVKGIRLLGYFAVGDASTAEYVRVATQPSHSGKVRTTDRFLPNGSTDATNGGWWELVMAGPQDVRKFGAVPGATDRTTAVNNAVSTCSIFFPASASNYVLSGDILVPSNRHFWVQKGATIINTGGRFTAFLPGGGNVHFQIDGVVGFLATTTAPGIGDWPQVAGDVHRALIEMGGTHVAPGKKFKVTGNGGRVYSDYVWAGVPTGITNMAFQMNRKGIAFINAAECLCQGLEVSGVYGEAVYFNGWENNYDIKFLNNYVHDCAFNGLNFNTSLAYQGLVMAHNTVQRVMQGIEISGGTADNNQIETCYQGFKFGGGSGIAGLRVTNNVVISAADVAYDLQFSPATPAIMTHIAGNQAISTGGTAFIINSMQKFQFKDNTSYNHGASKSGVSFNIGSACAAGHIDGNMTASPGAFSTGTYANNAGVANTAGTNPVY